MSKQIEEQNKHLLNYYGSFYDLNDEVNNVVNKRKKTLFELTFYDVRCRDETNEENIQFSIREMEEKTCEKFEKIDIHEISICKCGKSLKQCPDKKFFEWLHKALVSYSITKNFKGLDYELKNNILVFKN